MPQATVDPVVLAAMIVIRLQTFISRETAPGETAVLTVGSLAAGTKSNVISDHAKPQLNIRTYSDATRTAVFDAIRRIVVAECRASGAPKDPEFELFDRFPLTDNDPDTTARVATAFAAHFGDRSTTMPMGYRQRGLQRHPERTGCALHLLGHRRHRPRHVPQSRASRPSVPRHSRQPLGRLRPGPPTHARHRNRGTRGRRTRVAVTKGDRERRFHLINADRLDAFEMIDDNGKSSLWRRCR
jgi:hypothetical protein